METCIHGLPPLPPKSKSTVTTQINIKKPKIPPQEPSSHRKE